jgi:hypothetical protein
MPEYKIISMDGEDQSYVQLMAGHYRGCIYKYGKLEIPEDLKVENPLTLSFDYTIIKSPDIGYVEEIDDQFKELIGDILVDIITSEENKIETRDSYNEEFIDE